MSNRMFNRLPPSARGLLRAGVGLVLMVAGSAALAQSAANGKKLYESTDTFCFLCHGNNPDDNVESVKNGANDPGRILAACADPNVNNFGGMIGFCGPGGRKQISAAEAADLAAYIANPKALGAAITLSTTTLTFRRSIGGGASGRQNVSVTNTGDAALVLADVIFTGTNPADYKQLAPAAGAQCLKGTSVAPKASCSVDITFDPPAVGTRDAKLQVTPDAASGLAPAVVELKGTGTQVAESFATADAAAVNFGALLLNASVNKTLTVTNNGEANLVLDADETKAFALSGANAGEYSRDATSSCAAGLSVASGASCSLVLKFTPTATGTRAATLTVNSNGVALGVELSGAGLSADVNEGGGGCSTANPNATVDPMLLALSALALAVLGLRRRRPR